MSLWMLAWSNYQRRGFKSLMVSFGCTAASIGRCIWQTNWRVFGWQNGVDVVVRHLELENLGK